MPAEVEQSRGFTLSDFSGPGMPADDTPKDQQQTAPETAPEQTAAPEKNEPDSPDQPETDAPENEGGDEKTKKDYDPFRTLENALGEHPEEEKKKEREAAEAEAKKKADEEAAAAAEAEKEKGTAEPEKPNTDERDKDLKIEHGPNTHVNTRKKFDKVTTLAKAARDERDAAIARADAAEAKAREFEEKSKSTEPPKELVEEVKTLREKIRELDITQDPIIKTKYDAPFKENSQAIGEILKSESLPDNLVTAIVEQGATSGSVYRYVAALRNAAGKLAAKAEHPDTKPEERSGLMDASESALKKADDLVFYSRENDKLLKQKQAEINSWKGDFTKRQQAKESETKQQAEKRQAEFRHHTDTLLNRELDELAKNFSYIKKPAGPAPTDPPAVAQAKQKAIADYETAARQIEEAVKGLNPQDAPPEKFAETVGRINANAIQAIVLKTHVLPRVLKERTEMQARIKELEARLGKIDNAGRLSRAQGAATGDAIQRSGPEPQTFEDALKMGDPSRGA